MIVKQDEVEILPLDFLGPLAPWPLTEREEQQADGEANREPDSESWGQQPL